MAEGTEHRLGALPLASLTLVARPPLSLAGSHAGRSTAKPVASVHSRQTAKQSAALVTTEASTTPIAEPKTHSTGGNHVGKLVLGAVAGLGSILFRPKDVIHTPGSLVASRVFPGVLHRRAPTGGNKPSGAGAARKPAIMWFRNDLRLHDNEALVAACQASSSLLPVYIFDPREYGKGPTGFDKTGPHRAQFILDSVADLRARLRAAGSDLLVRRGKPEDVLARLAGEVGAGGVYFHGEVTAEEVQVEQRVRSSLEAKGVEVHSYWSGTLFHVDDLPFRLEAMPTNFADFKDKMTQAAVRPAVESKADSIKGLPAGNSVECGAIPSLKDLGLTSAPTPARTNQHGRGTAGGPAAYGAQALRGGEAEALRQLDAFVQELRSWMASAANKASGSNSNSATRATSSPNFSCRVSPWLALGCLSPRHMFQELQARLGKDVAAMPPRGHSAAGSASSPALSHPSGNASWLVFELLWRDFFRFVTRKYSAMQQQQAGAVAGAGAAQHVPSVAMAAAV